MAKLAKYELLAKIASGGMAEIHVARSRVGGRSSVCVVKKLLPQHTGNEEFLQMFLDEGRIAALFVDKGIQPLQEKVYGLSAIRELVLQQRGEIFRSRGLDRTLPVTWIQGTPLNGCDFVGVQI